MNILKRSLAIALSLSLLFGDASLVIAGTKKATKKKKTTVKSSKRSGSSKSSRRSGTSKSSKRSSRAGKVARAASTKRAMSSSKMTSATDTSTTASDSASPKGVNCRNAYAECMDIQISGLLSRYTYLGDDAAVEAIQETGDPLRCVYYYNDPASTDTASTSSDTAPTSSTTLLKSATATTGASTTATTDGAEGAEGATATETSSVPVSNKNINTLYYAYNYYCAPAKSTGSSGQPINVCNWDTSNNSFASKKSYAFYNEAYKRLKNDELSILNFTETALYQNKIKAFMGDDASTTYQISPSDVSGMLQSLGLDTSEIESNQTFFVVNVAPPTDAGSLDPRGVFQKAHEICMGNGTMPTTKSGISEDNLKELKNYVKTLSSSTCQGLADDFIDYYQNGTWKGCKSGYKYSSSDDMCVKKTDATDMIDLELVDTGFLSAKNSCSSYEQALIANRERIYAKFQDQLTNYLNDNLAQLIKKEAKGQSTIANAFNTLYKTDAENKASKLQAEAEIQQIKADAEIAKSESDAALADATAKAATARSNALQVKKDAVNKLVASNRSKLLKQCDTSASELPLDANFSKELSNLKVCMKDDGKVLAYGDSGCGSNTELLCVDDIGFNANTFTESKVAEVQWSEVQIPQNKRGSLPAGFYKVIVAGAKGPSGSGASSWGHSGSGGSGGNGHIEEKVFSLDSSKEYTASFNSSVGGGSSNFTISGVVSVSAAGGGRGGNAYCRWNGPFNHSCPDGSSGSSAGNGKNSGGGYVRLYKPKQ
ncbi:MAG: hypothetical protein K6F04_01580 [bacterium]|nr:hypothetical protein [bacterium]